MPRKPEAIEIIRQRADNYVFHFECRTFFQTLPEPVQEKYKSHKVRLPALNEWGATDYSKDELQQMITIGNEHGLDAWLLIPWYHDPIYWDDFQTKWRIMEDGKVVHRGDVDNPGNNVYNMQVFHKPAPFVQLSPLEAR